MSGMHILTDLMTTQRIFKELTMVETLQGFLRMLVFSEHVKLINGKWILKKHTINKKKKMTSAMIYFDLASSFLYDVKLQFQFTELSCR